jgi:hypothetical protein
MDRQWGIRKPAMLEAALSFRTTFTPPGGVPPYEDTEGPDGLVRYKYRGDDPNHPENVALRRAYERQLPLIWFVGVDRGLYLPRFPVWLVADAAHILRDGHPRGLPVVPNGLGLCKIHHSAYDQDIVGVRPDLVVEVRQDILKEVDGPMLRHGLQEMAGARLLVPRTPAAQPDRSALEERYEEFRQSA